MTRSVFLSYCRADSQRVQRLAEDIRALGYSPWLDQEIGGGQDWWDEILRQIRGADIVVIALSAAALESVACLREYEYAAALGKAILPVSVDANFVPALMPASLAALQVVTWKPDNARAALHLSRAFMNMAASRSLPSVLPTPPPAPLSYLVSLHERVTAPHQLSLNEQSALLLELKQRARTGKDREELRALMQALRARFDLYASVAEELDDVLQDQDAGAARSSTDDNVGALSLSPAQGRELGTARSLSVHEEALSPEQAQVSAASALPSEAPSAAPNASVVDLAATSSTTHASLSPIETSISTVRTWRKRKPRILFAAGVACLFLAGFGVLTYVSERPASEEPKTTTHDPGTATAETSESAVNNGLTVSPTVSPTEHEPTETAGAEALPAEEVMQPTAPTPKTAPIAPTPKKRAPRPVPAADPTPSSLFTQMADALHTWKVTAKQDCEPDTVRPRDCLTAEKTTASLNRNGTVTWGQCSCKLNAAAIKAIEDMAAWIL